MSSCFRRGGGGGATSANNILQNTNKTFHLTVDNENMTETQTKQSVKETAFVSKPVDARRQREVVLLLLARTVCLRPVYLSAVYFHPFILNCYLCPVYFYPCIFFIYIVYSSPAYFHPFIILKIYFSPIVHIAPSLLLLPPPPHGKGDLALKARLKKNI